MPEIHVWPESSKKVITQPTYEKQLLSQVPSEQKWHIAPKIGPMTRTTSHILLCNSTNQYKQPVMSSANELNLRWRHCDGWTSNVTDQEKDINMRPPGGVREREEYRHWAGHEIKLEIEDVLDNKKWYFPAQRIASGLQADKLSSRRAQ